VIVGGTFRGLSRAIRQSLSFIWVYTVAGVPPIFVIGILLAGGRITPELLAIGHVFVIIVMLPAAVIGNFLALRALGWRSWRHEPWRARTAGIVAVVLVWAGILVAGGQGAVPEPLVATLGELGFPIFFLAVVITGSNLALLIAWLQPPRKKWTPRSR
jgi:hypothetical protein